MIPKKILTNPEHIKSLLSVEFPISIKKNPIINNNENGIEVKNVPGIRF